ncbi:MAG: hypothetical protein HC853_06200 [Anaerolineae bacterium]|nr:hypothetical protein [Anaerolineae bacterium]
MPKPNPKISPADLSLDLPEKMLDSDTPELDRVLTGDSGREIFEALNETLKAMLQHELSSAGKLGQDLADGLKVSHISFYSDKDLEHLNQYGFLKSELGAIGGKLTDQLRVLLKERGVPDSQYQHTYVRKLSFNYAGNDNPNQTCKYYEYRNNKYIESCYRACNTC